MSANTTPALVVPTPRPAVDGDAGRNPLLKPSPCTGRKDYFVRRNGREFAGTHLILDFWEASHLDDLQKMECALREAVAASGATLLHVHLHHFTENGGISGVAVLAESHISVHTWPERGFAAFDIFMCGDTAPERSIAVLERVFRPRRVVTHTCLRGEVPGDE